MSKNEFFIVRHAESENNLLELESSKLENKDQFGLTEIGRKQTEVEANTFRSFDFIYTSPFRRAIETAMIFARTSGCRVIEDEGLREVCVGDFELCRYQESELFIEKHGEAVPFPNGESLTDARDRAIDFLEQVDDKHTDASILIVSHGDIVLFLIEYLDKTFDRTKAREQYDENLSRKVFRARRQ